MNSPIFHESVLKKFEAFMTANNAGHLVDYFHNPFVNREEGYKECMACNARKEIDALFAEGRNKPSAKEVLTLIKRFLNINFRANLVAWQSADKAEKKLEQDIQANNESAADIFRSLCCDEKDGDTFERIKDYLGSHFDLIAYLFFLKNHKAYTPIKSQIFDTIFRDYSIDAPKLWGNIDWHTYLGFVGTIKIVQAELQTRYPDYDISLLDAHSFLWILGEDKFKLFDEQECVENKETAELREKERAIISQARIGQGKYRTDMIAYWEGACSVTGCRQTELLIASHAKPWKDSSVNECVDVFNGLLLIPNLDKLFDLGYISFADSGQIIISDKLGQAECSALGISEKMSLSKVDTRHLPYLRYHRENVFQQ